MKKKGLLLLASLLGFATAQADDFPYLAFETAEGAVHTLSVEELRITFTDGTLMASSAGGELTVSLADLSKMYFTSVETGVAQAPTAAGAEGAVYNLQGVRIATLSGNGTLPQDLPQGIYIVKRKGKTEKIAVR